MSNDFQKALKINKYVWDKWVWLSSTPCRDTKDLLFLFSAGLLPPKFKQNSLVQSWFCSMVPRKGIFSSQGGWDVTELNIHLLQPIVHLILAQLCHSYGLWSAAEGGTQVRDSDYLLQVPEHVLLHLSSRKTSFLA